MSTSSRVTRRIRWDGPDDGLHVTIAAGGAIVLYCLTWLIIGLVHVWSHPVIGWLPMPVSALLAGHMCWRVTRRVDELAAPTRRYWRHMSFACLVLTAGIVSNTFDAVGGPRPAQGIGPLTLVCFLTCSGWACGRCCGCPPGNVPVGSGPGSASTSASS